MRTFAGPGAFRYFLALIVLVHHLTHFSVGITAVYIFFVLSGYWIYQMWTAKYAHTLQPYLTYLVSRAWRLYPVFWAASLLAVALGHRDSRGWLSQLVIFGYQRLPNPPNNPAWSLDIEMQFYLVAPLLAVGLRKFPAAVILACAAVLSLIAAIFWRDTLATFGIFFVIGMAAAHTQWRPGKPIVIAGCALITASMAAYVLLPAAHRAGLMQAVWGLLAIPLAIWTTHRRSGSIDKVLADASYTLYLFHWPICEWMSHHWKGAGADVFIAAVAIALSIAAAVYFDQPIQLLRSAWLRGRRISDQRASDSAALPSSSR